MSSLKWLKELEIAIIEELFEQIDALASNIPNFENEDEANRAKALLDEALDLVKNEKNLTSKQIKIIEKNLAFLDSDREHQLSLEV